MPRLLMVAQPTIAGVAQCVHDWSVGLRARGWDVFVACPPGPGASDCLKSEIPVETWQSVRSPQAHVIREARALRRIVVATQPDVVMLHSSKAGLVGRLAILGSRPSVFVPHAWSFDALGGLAAAAATHWERHAARWTRLIICVSEAERRRGQDVGINAPMVVARNGVDVAALKAFAAGDRGELRARLGVAAGTTVVVCVGRLSAQKGQDLLLDAWGRLRSCDAGVQLRQLYLIGDGPATAALRAEAASLPDVTFVGAVDRATAIQWLAAADLVVVPSRWEGMALVPIEALAVGTPVVATDVTGAKEAVGPPLGALVAPDDPAALTEVMAKWLAISDTERSLIATQAESLIASEFSLDRTVETVDAALRDILRH